MKNKLLNILILAPLMVGCSSQRPDYSNTLSIISPTGAPAVAFYNYASDILFETNADAATGIIPLLPGASKDIVVLPTNAGMQAIINRGVNYQIAATITFGNLYVCATGLDDDGVMDKDDYIVLFQKGNVPDKIFHYVYGTDLDEGIHYNISTENAAKSLATAKDPENDNHPVDYVLLAEPAITKVLGQKPERSVYANLQDLYKEKSGGLEMFQASIFVNKNSDKDTVNTFLESLRYDIEDGLKDSNLIAEGMNKASEPSKIFGVDPTVIPSVINKDKNGLGLGFKYARDNKAAIDKFLSIWNIGETSEEVYYK